jgi:hypothetical protein
MLRLFRHPLILAIALTVAVAAAVPAAPAASAQGRNADFSEFYQALEPYGRWFEHPRWGLVWWPDVQQDEDWRPYSRGQWVYTDDHGWYWDSDEEWGWATYHYGRWVLDERYGWLWVPGHEWGPAWVAWRESDEHIGWAPLPPDAVWEPDYGVRYSYVEYEAPHWAPIWCFVEPRYLLAPRVWHHFSPRSRNLHFLGRTRHVTRYNLVRHRIFNRGVDVRHLARITRRSIPALQVRTINRPHDTAWRRGERNFVGIYRPQLAANPKGARFTPRLTAPDAIESAKRARATPRDLDPRGQFDRNANRRLDPSGPNNESGERNQRSTTPPTANLPKSLNLQEQNRSWRERPASPPSVAGIPPPQPNPSDRGERSFRNRIWDKSPSANVGPPPSQPGDDGGRTPRSRIWDKSPSASVGPPPPPPVDNGRRSFRDRSVAAPPAASVPFRRDPPSGEQFRSRRESAGSGPPAGIAPRIRQQPPAPQMQASPRPQPQIHVAPQRQAPAQNNQQRERRRDRDRDSG